METYQVGGEEDLILLFQYLCTMLQVIIIAILLIASVYYLGRMVHKALKGDVSCGGGCAKCAVTENKSLEIKKLF